MYAVVQSGGKQFRIQPGDRFRVEKIEREQGEEFDLDRVLAVGGDELAVGQPYLEDAKVTVMVVQQVKGPKIRVFKKKRRQGYRRTQGHRQLFTELFVKSITSPDGQMEATEKTALFEKLKEEQPVEASKELQKTATKKKTTKKVAKKKKAPAKKKSVAKKKTKKKVLKKAAVTKKKAKKK